MQKYHRAARAFKALLSHHISIDVLYQIQSDPLVALISLSKQVLFLFKPI